MREGGRGVLFRFARWLHRKLCSHEDQMNLVTPLRLIIADQIGSDAMEMNVCLLCGEPLSEPRPTRRND